MKIESLYPYNNVYQVLDDDNLVLYQGKQADCMLYITFNTKEK